MLRLGLRLRPQLRRGLSSVPTYGPHEPTVVSDEASDTVVINAAPGQHTASIVFLHGLGDTSAGWLDACTLMASHLPSVKIVLPNAPTQCVTMNGGMPMPSWYDIKGLNSRDDETCEGIEDSRARVEALLRRETSEFGIPSSSIVLAGFSQGGALSLYTGLQSEERLAGVLCMSGYLPLKNKSFAVSAAAAGTPVQFMHGTDDQVVRVEFASGSCAHLETLGLQPEWRQFAGMEHSACIEEINEAVTWCQGVLGLNGGADRSSDSDKSGGGGGGGGEMQALPGGLLTTFRDLKLGSEADGSGVVVAGATVTVHATGVVVETGKAFWSTKDPGQQPFQYQAGVGSVIKGWDQGCLGMRKGGVRELVIPAVEGYGADGFPEWDIPAGGTLRFTIEVLSIGDFAENPFS